jgi:FkbM family methyltransferase
MNRRSISHALTSPARSLPMPALAGPARGLRLRMGNSDLGALAKGHEPQVEQALLELLNPGDVLYDIGANVGWYSLIAARHTRAPVVAFEPLVDNAAIIRQNARTNRLPVTVVPAAVTNTDGWAAFQDNGSLLGRLDKSDSPAQADRRARKAASPRLRGVIPVPAVTLDNCIGQAGLPAPDVIKLDIEGAEIGALQGMTRTLAEHRPRLLIELHSTQQEVADLLDAAGYEHHPVEVDVPTRDAPWWVHVVARPSR